jgi:hypothetical protein
MEWILLLAVLGLSASLLLVASKLFRERDEYETALGLMSEENDVLRATRRTTAKRTAKQSAKKSTKRSK